MAWDEGSFLEGAIAGAGTGAAAGTVVAPGAGTIALSIVGALVGGLVKLRIVQTLLVVAAIYGISKIGVLPPFMIIIFIIVFVLWLMGGGKR